MFLFGHLGIGSKIVSPLSRGLPRSALLWGTMFPDIIDKPLYYGLAFITGKHGADIGLISGSRTIGHTALFLFIITLTAVFKKSRILAALSLGIASHLLLDSWSTLVFNIHTQVPQVPFRNVLLWPLISSSFPVMPFHDASEHLSVVAQPALFWAEAVGAGILLWDYWKQRRFHLSAS